MNPAGGDAVNGPRMDRERWARLTIEEQLGNIGSDVGRAFNARRKGDEERVESCVNLALDLFLATVEVLLSDKTELSRARAREVFIARDEFMAALYCDRFYDAEKIEAYFMNFAYIARTQELEAYKAKGGTL
jgi:hypothetical protein